MELKMYTIYDVKTKAYHKPFYSNTNGAAIRAFSNAVNDPVSDFNKNPEDYTLFEIGHYNDTEGTLHPLEVKIPLGTALEMIKERTK